MPLDKTDGQQVAKVVTGSSLIKVGDGRVVMASVLTLAGGAITLHDAASVGEASGLNIIAHVPDLLGIYLINMPFMDGLVLVAGAGVLSLSYN